MAFERDAVKQPSHSGECAYTRRRVFPAQIMALRPRLPRVCHRGVIAAARLVEAKRA